MKSPLALFIQIGCGVFFLLGVFLCSVVLFFSKAQSDKFWQTGVHVDGVVLRIEAETQKLKGGNQRIVSETVQFEYLIEGQIFRDWDAFNYNTDFYVGQTIPVIYDPHEPWNAQILVDASPVNRYTPVIIGAGIFVLLGFVLYMVQPPSEKQKRKNEEKYSL